VARDEMLWRLLIGLHHALERNASLLEQESRFLDAAAHLLDHHSEAPPPPPLRRREHRHVRRIRDYLEMRYAENVSLAELGTLAGVSPFHLLRTCRDEVGIPPHEYQMHVRIERAKWLLRSGRTLAQTAAEVGFADQSHLTRHFKRIVGITPGQFAPDRKIVQDGDATTQIG